MSSIVALQRDEHSLSVEMKLVHDRLLNKYNLEKSAKKDIIRAKKMEMYLRKFKALGDKFNQDTSKPNYQLSLEDQALEQVADQVGVALGLGQKKGNSLFRWTHKMGLRSSVSGVDDIFEAELSSLLQIAAQKATSSITNSGVEVVGQLSGNIAKGLMKELQRQGPAITQNSFTASGLISVPQARSAKVDVTGYSAKFVATADIKPEWKEFINLFKGAKMTLKNYSGSNPNYETIHLGKTVPQKAILGSLNSLGLSNKQAVHIYYHLINHNPIEAEGSHILHLRFQYELTGGGLYTSDGTKIDEADFFVYNDPTSGNIWVRSTKAMIAEMSKYTGKIGNPLHSGVVVLKSSFI